MIIVRPENVITKKNTILFETTVLSCVIHERGNASERMIMSRLLGKRMREQDICYLQVNECIG